MREEQEKAIKERLAKELLPKRFSNYAFRVVPTADNSTKFYRIEQDWVGGKRPTNSQVQLCYTAINSYIEGYIQATEDTLKGD